MHHSLLVLINTRQHCRLTAGGHFQQWSHQQKHKGVIKKKELVYSMRSKTGSIVWPQLGMCNSGNQNFSLLCTCPPMTGHATVWFGHTNTFLWIGKFANMESSNNEDQLYLFVWKKYIGPRFNTWLNRYYPYFMVQKIETQKVLVVCPNTLFINAGVGIRSM